MKYPQSSYTFNGQEITLAWIRTNSLSDLYPITQIYGICFNDQGEILVCREKADGKWQIPGGHPEAGETSEITLVRELEEEVDVKVKNAKVLGVQKVNYPNNPDKTEGEEFFQARLICDLDELLPPTPDPATGNTWERVFVSADKIAEYIKWGSVGEAMFKDATKLWEETHK